MKSLRSVRSRLAALAATLVLAGSVVAATPLEQATAALQAGDLATADTLLAPLATGERPDVAALSQLVTVRLRQKRTKEAIALAERAAQLAPANPELQAQVGGAIAQRMGEVTFMQQAMLSGKMRRAFEKAVELNPDHLGGLIGLSRYCTNAPEIAGGSLEKAREYALRIQKLEPLRGAIELGNIAAKAEDHPAALAHYEAAAQLAPNNASLQAGLGATLAALGRKDEARARFQAALQLDPNLASARQGLADLAQP